MRFNAKHGEFAAFPFSFQLMFDHTLSNLIVCLRISEKIHTKVAQTSTYVAVDTR